MYNINSIYTYRSFRYTRYQCRSVGTQCRASAHRDMSQVTRMRCFNRDKHRALVDWVGDREPWPGWFGQGLRAMPPNLRGYQAYEADRTRWVLQRPRGTERMEAATVRRLQWHADLDGARRLARERPVVTASDLTVRKEGGWTSALRKEVPVGVED